MSADWKVVIICNVEQKTFSVIFRIFHTNAPPLWFPLYFGLQKCWRWQFIVKIWWVWLKCVCKIVDITYFPHKWVWLLKIFTQNADLKGVIICIVEQKTFSVILRIFLTNAPPLWFPLYFGIQKCWRWQFLLKIDEGYG